MDRVFIYTLADPKNGAIRYVGKTNNLTTRFRHHINKRKHTHVGNWLYSLRLLGLNPIMEELDVIDHSIWRESEKYWIAQLRQWGFDLTNIHEGGEGNGGGHTLKLVHQKGKKVSAETRSRMSATHRNRDHSYKKGRKITDQARLNRIGVLGGEKNGQAKLSNEQVREIRSRLLNKEKTKLLAKEYNVSQTNIYYIKHKTTFKDI